MKFPVAVELFSAGICNMDCKYCYIPKNNKMKEINNRIKEKIISGEYIDDLKKMYGDKLEYITLWGTEPTMNLSLINKYLLNKLIYTFPKIKEINFSTNLYDNIGDIIILISKLSSFNKKIVVDIQLSIDGYPKITNENRKEGSAQRLEANYKYLIQQVEKMNLNRVKVKFHFKPTTTIDNMKELMQSNNLYNWFLYFDQLHDFFDKTINKNKFQVTMFKGTLPSLVCPGNYTKEDGVVFAKFCKRLFDLSTQKHGLKHYYGSLNLYVHRFSRLVRYGIMNPRRQTCSAGDTQLGVDINGNFGLCHDMFYLSEDDYIQECNTKDKKSFNKMYTMRNKFTGKIDSNNDINKLLYVYSEYHDFWKLKFSYGRSLVHELINNNEIDSCFKNEKICLLFLLFLNTSMGCPTNNLMITGVQHLLPISLFRIWGNGAFHALLKDYLYWQKELIK